MCSLPLLLCPFLHPVTGNVEMMAGALAASSDHEAEGYNLGMVFLSFIQMLP